MKYHDRMSAEETAALLAQCQSLEDAYADAAQHDESALQQWRAEHPHEEPPEFDEFEDLRRAALSRGQP